MKKQYSKPQLAQQRVDLRDASIRTCKNADEYYMPTEVNGQIVFMPDYMKACMKDPWEIMTEQGADGFCYFATTEDGTTFDS